MELRNTEGMTGCVTQSDKRLGRRYIMMNVYLPKINIILHFGDDRLALSCSSDPKQILVILP